MRFPYSSYLFHSCDSPIISSIFRLFVILTHYSAFPAKSQYYSLMLSRGHQAVSNDLSSAAPSAIPAGVLLLISSSLASSALSFTFH